MSQRKFLESVAPIAALLLCTSVVACTYSASSQSTSSSSGSGGEGGSSGTGNTGGNGGSGGGMASPICTMQESTVALEPWPWFGFEQALPTPMPDLANGAPASISAIEAGGLRILFDGTTTDVRLAWAGPDLNQIFTTGDMVTVTTDAGLQDYRVSGAKGQAVVLRYANANVPTMLPTIPGGGPNLSMELECVYEQLKTCPMPERRTLYNVTASIGSANLSLPSGMKGTIGSWQIQHVKSMNIELYTAMDCTPDHIFDGAIHAIEVKP